LLAEDPREPPPIRSPDPGDDYLIALAADVRAILVSGDDHLLGLAADMPIVSPADFLRLLEEQRARES
jgi:predicted nucleic acid-binding protein